MINKVLETEFLWHMARWESNGRYLSECMCVTGVGRVWSIYSSLPWLLLPTTKFKKRSRSSFWPSASSSSRLSPQEGTGRLDAFLHSILSSTMCRSTTLPSSRTQPIHHFLGRPLLLVPGSLRFADHLTNSFSSILFTCPYHLSLHSRIFSFSSATFNSCLMSSFLILSRLVTPLMARKHLISTTSNFFTCSSFTAQVSAPYIGSPVLPSFCTPTPSVSSASVCHILNLIY